MFPLSFTLNFQARETNRFAGNPEITIGGQPQFDET